LKAAKRFCFAQADAKASEAPASSRSRFGAVRLGHAPWRFVQQALAWWSRTSKDHVVEKTVQESLE
jgi:hypothetical protein